LPTFLNLYFVFLDKKGKEKDQLTHFLQKRPKAYLYYIKFKFSLINNWFTQLVIYPTSKLSSSSREGAIKIKFLSLIIFVYLAVCMLKNITCTHEPLHVDTNITYGKWQHVLNNQNLLMHVWFPLKIWEFASTSIIK
jgi:hypothetical protein